MVPAYAATTTELTVAAHRHTVRRMRKRRRPESYIALPEPDGSSLQWERSRRGPGRFVLGLAAAAIAAAGLAALFFGMMPSSP